MCRLTRKFAVPSAPTNERYFFVARDRLKPGGLCRAAKGTVGAPFCEGVIVLEGTVHHRAADLEHQMRTAWRPTHLLLRVHPAMQQPLHSAFGDRRGDWLLAPPSRRKINDDIVDPDPPALPEPSFRPRITPAWASPTRRSLFKRRGPTDRRQRSRQPLITICICFRHILRSCGVSASPSLDPNPSVHNLPVGFPSKTTLPIPGAQRSADPFTGETHECLKFGRGFTHRSSIPQPSVNLL